MQKIIVTGGAGFIGSHLIEFLLKKNLNVLVVDNLSTGRKVNIEKFKNQIEFYNLDICHNQAKLDKIFSNCHGVFHLAALADIVPSITNPQKYYNSNVKGTLNILNACVKNNIKRIVYAASSSCYGIPNKFPTTEKSKIDCRYPYALTKYIGEQLIMHWSKLYDLEANSLRLFNVYGTRSRTSGTYGAVFGVFLAQKLAGEPLTVVGNGEQSRDFTYVTDVVKAMFEVFSKKNIKNEIFNVGSGNTVSINKIAKLIGGKKVFIPKRPGEPDCTFADINKITSKTNWKPSININKGIKLILSDINYWKKAPVWTPEKIEAVTKDWFDYVK